MSAQGRHEGKRAGASGRYRIAVDIGGTFTDFVLFDEADGSLTNEKVLTTPQDPSEGVLQGIRLLLERTGRAPAQALPVIHGTTLVANALIERKGVKTALVTTAGFRDVLEVGREWRYDIYDLGIEPPQPLVPRPLRFGVRERIGPDGAVLDALDESGVREIAAQLDASDVVSVAVCFLHAFRNPAHELRAREIFAAAAPRLKLSLSSRVVPEIGEYERMSTTVANATVQPIFERYLERLSAGLASLGLPAELYLMLSDGGTMHQDTARAYPIRLVQSGPAGGVRAASLYGALAGLTRLLCFDMGGTTAKACLIEDGEPERAHDFEVARVYRFKKGSGVPLKVPVIDMIEIGAGGGSIAHIDRLGLLRVGPESASADPGPACYGRGGSRPTVTDADLVLGYLDAGRFLGGDMQLDAGAARAAIERDLCRPMGLDLEAAAWGLLDTVHESMAQAASIHALEKARRISDYALVAIGGAGPVHAWQVARKLGIRTIVAPSGAGVASALGFLAAPISFSFVQAEIATLASLDLARTAARLRELEAEGRALVAASGVEPSYVRARLMCEMRYLGQGHEIEVDVPSGALEAGERDALHAAFLAAYRAQYGRVERIEDIETVAWRVTVAGPTPRPDIERAPEAGGAARPGAALRGTRRVWFPREAWVDAPVYDRYAIARDAEFDGPAIVEERESTLVVPPGARCRAARAGTLIVAL